MGTAQANGSHAGEEQAGTRTAEPPSTAAGPIATHVLGEFLVREGLLTEAQLTHALRVRGTGPAAGRLEDVLVAEGILSRAELEGALRRYRHRYRLGDLLLSTGAITEAQLQLAVDHHLRTGLRLGDSLLQLSFLTEDALREALCRQLDVTFVDLDRMLVDRQLAPLVPKEYAQHHRVVPVASAEGTLTVAVADPTDGWVADDLQAATGCRVRLVTSTAAAFQRAFARVYGEDPAVGLARRHHRLEQAHASVSRELEAALRGLEELRRAHEEFLSEHADTLRSVAAEHANREGALAELEAAHAALREEHDRRERAHAELARAQAATLDSLAALQGEHARLQEEARATARQLADERQRRAELARALAELEAAHAAARRQIDERLDALTALDAAYAEATHGLAELRAAHAALRAEHERAVRELTERAESAERRQAIAVGQLEALLARLRA
jgi:hypothetical protein